MNPETLRSFQRVLDRLERRAKRPARRFSTAPIVLGLALGLGYLLLTGLVPRVVAMHEDGAFGNGRGVPLVVVRLAEASSRVGTPLPCGILALTVIAFLAASRSRLVRLLVWLAAAAAIAANAALLLATFRQAFDLAGSIL